MSKKAKFDRQLVIENATNLYWEKGYHATSMRNLQDAIDMRPGSIYAEFGSKDGVFKASLEHYAQLGLAELENLRVHSTSPVEALKSFVKQVVIDSQDESPSCMCMLAKTVAELTDDQPELLSVAKSALKSVEDQFAQLIVEAQKKEEVGKSKDPQELARFLQIQITGLRVYARTSDDNGPLEKMIDELFDHHPFQ
ncbi:TetR/AcrR family transcriptional regulator [Marinomonas sp. 5E14-1]|uniref:TetR/AcrR family transcriptional regulator n=1 Tax=Marinomonas sp. 5E14-1 TaxID=3153922 RepID=UPI003264923C